MKLETELHNLFWEMILATPAREKGFLNSQPVFPFINPLSNDVTQMVPKIEPATFEGKEPRAWLRKCVKYFEINRVHNRAESTIGKPVLDR